MQDLIDMTRDVHYENYRAKYITERMSKRQTERRWVIQISCFQIFYKTFPLGIFPYAMAISTATAQFPFINFPYLCFAVWYLFHFLLFSIYRHSPSFLTLRFLKFSFE